MSLTTDLSVEDEPRVLPVDAKYGPSIFANTVTGLSIVFVIAIAALFLWGILTTFLAYRHFERTRALPDGLSTKNPVWVDPDTGEEQTLDYLFWLRWAVGGYLLAILLYFPTRWLFRTYGRQSLDISEEGIAISKFSIGKLLRFPFSQIRGHNKTFPYVSFSNEKLFPWEGILDVTVKDSTSVFAFFNRGANKISVYTMDTIISIESMTLGNQREISAKLTAYGDSLEERVIDFGYGAAFSVVWRRIKRSKVGVLGAFIVVFFIFLSIFAVTITIVRPINTLEAELQERSLFNLWNPNYFNVADLNEGPSSSHWFGTDAQGRDIFSRLIFGAFYSILIGVVATLISTTLGAIIGAASGYLGGTFDQIVQRVTEVFIAMPQLPILLLVSSSFTPLIGKMEGIEGAYYLFVFGLFAFIGWGGVARIVRAEVLALKNNEFIAAERVLGATHWRIITKHIMPNAFSTIIIFFTLGVGASITAVAAISYLGFGSQSTLVWGKDLSDAVFNQPLKYWWAPTFISLALFLIVLGFNLLGDALRDALDPRLKE
ncbi:MAG: ABC transporter permease [Candidatus Kariarchaeaceae archaeon]|jgi:ABC-type dipeptide/oligopeptide/nickel transport system permease subunit